MLGYYNAVFAILVMLGGVARAEVNETPTIIEVSAATPDGGQNVMVVEQPKDAPNPLGSPLPDVVSQPSEIQENKISKNPVQSFGSGETENLNENTTSNEQINNPQQEAIKLGKDFQNTLVEANGRIYDVQSYPEEDIKVMSNPAQPQTIYSPNVND